MVCELPVERIPDRNRVAGRSGRQSRRRLRGPRTSGRGRAGRARPRREARTTARTSASSSAAPGAGAVHPALKVDHAFCQSACPCVVRASMVTPLSKSDLFTIVEREVLRDVSLRDELVRVDRRERRDVAVPREVVDAVLVVEHEVRGTRARAPDASPSGGSRSCRSASRRAHRAASSRVPTRGLPSGR